MGQTERLAPHHRFARVTPLGYEWRVAASVENIGTDMGDLIELKTRIAKGLDAEDTADFDAFLATEGLTLLADFRSIGDPAVRASILQMVGKIAAALRAAKASTRL